MSGFRARFLRDVLDVLERERGTATVSATWERLGSRMSSAKTVSLLRASGPGDMIPIGDAEELLLALDAGLGDGSGKLIEHIAFEIFTRVLVQGALVVPGDLMGTVARLEAPLSSPFMDLRPRFDIASSTTGFSLYLVVPQRPRSARILRHIATGAIRAAQRYSREGASDDVKIFGDTVGDRVNLDVRVGAPKAESATGLDSTPPTLAVPTRRYARKPSSPPIRTSQPTLERVERILGRARAPAVPPEVENLIPREAPLPIPPAQRHRPTSSPTLPGVRYPSGNLPRIEIEESEEDLPPEDENEKPPSSR